MKKNLLYALFAIVALSSCSGSEEDDYAHKSLQELWLGGYTAIWADTSYDVAQLQFLFFKADGGRNFVTPQHRFSGDENDYKELSDETYSLLLDGKIKLATGEIVAADYTGLSNYKEHEAETEISIPPGKYFVCAYKTNPNIGQHYYKFKYAAMYYELTSRYNAHAISAVIPNDPTRYGMIDWVSWSERFDYEWDLH